MSSTEDVPMADAGAGELLLVWPWTGVLATTAVAGEDDEAASLLTAHARQHPAAVAATPLVQDVSAPGTHLNHHFLVLHFGKALAGLQAAASLADSFASAGRAEWQQQRHGQSAGPGAMAVTVYGWTAVEEDLRGEDAVGRFLRATACAARSADDAVAGEHETAARLLEARCEEAAAAVRAAEEETSFFRDELAELRTMADENMPEMNREAEEENAKLKAALEAATKEIELKMDKIAQLEDLEKGALGISTLDQAGAECKVDGHALMLHENHKQEMEVIHAKRTQLEEQLEHREALVFMVQHLNRKLQAGEKLTDTVADHQRLYTVTFYLDDERERLKASWLDLYEKEQRTNKELQENRQELIQGFENMLITGHATVGIKRMGQLDERTFQAACKRKYRDNDPEGKAASLVSSWQEEIQKPSWHPFTTIQVDGEDKEVIDDDDPKLRQLRLECGDNVYHAVKAALSELNEYSPHGRHVMNEIWNFQEGRKATITEAITCILEQLTVAVADPGLGRWEFNVPPKKCSASI